MALAPHATIAADQSAIDPNTACATTFAATKVDGDPNAAFVRITDPLRPAAGKIIAYGTDKVWTATVARTTLNKRAFNGSEESFTIRADAPIEGIIYAPEWASCTFHAGVQPRERYDRPDLRSPVLVLANPVAAEPAVCARPYSPPTVGHAVEPDTPLAAMQMGTQGTVRVAVALDERGIPRFSRIISTPGGVLNAASTSSAMRSTYSPAIFRCRPVPSGYEFSVEFTMNR
jgi:hypothetical protein